MTERHSASTITDAQLDEMYARIADLERAEAELRQYSEAESADAAAGSYALRAEQAEADMRRVTTLYDRWVQAGPPPLGTLIARWWDKRLVELHNAIRADYGDSIRMQIDTDAREAATEATGGVCSPGTPETEPNNPEQP
jgi:hypothetical protein